MLRVLDYYTIFNLQYGSEFRTISSDVVLPLITENTIDRACEKGRRIGTTRKLLITIKK